MGLEQFLENHHTAYGGRSTAPTRKIADRADTGNNKLRRNCKPEPLMSRKNP